MIREQRNVQFKPIERKSESRYLERQFFVFAERVNLYSSSFWKGPDFSGTRQLLGCVWIWLPNALFINLGSFQKGERCFVLVQTSDISFNGCQERRMNGWARFPLFFLVLEYTYSSVNFLILDAFETEVKEEWRKKHMALHLNRTVYRHQTIIIMC